MDTYRRRGIDGNYVPVLGCELVDEGCRNCGYLKGIGVRHPAELSGIKFKEKGAWTGNVLYRGGATRSSYGKCKMVGTDIFQPSVSDKEVSEVLSRCMEGGGYYAICTKRTNRAVYYFSRANGNGLYIPSGLVLGTSVPTQGEVWRVGVLMKAPVRKLVMFAPLLEDIGRVPLDGITQVIANGEIARGNMARETKAEWIDKIYESCISQGIRFTCDDLGNSLRAKHGIESDDDENRFKAIRWPKSRIAW